MASAASWNNLVADKRRRQAEAIPKEWLITAPPPSEVTVTAIPDSCGLLSEREILITNTEVDDLLSKLAAGEWSAVEVATAFYKRAIISHQLVSHGALLTCDMIRRLNVIGQVNCLTEIFVDRALARARELDDHFKATGRVVGPLHGLPISCKDQLCIKGLETTMGAPNSLLRLEGSIRSDIERG